MARVSLKATASFPYGGRRLVPGDLFDATVSHARLLKAIGRAVYVEPTIPSPAPVQTVAASSAPLPEPIEITDTLADAGTRELIDVMQTSVPDTPTDDAEPPKRRRRKRSESTDPTPADEDA